MWMWSVVPPYMWTIFGIGLVVSVAFGIFGGIVGYFRWKETRDGKR